MTHITAALLALWLVLGATTHAHALPIGIAIAGAIGLGGLGVWTTVAGALIIGAIGVGLQLVAGALFRKRGSADVGGTTGKMQTGGVVPRSFPVGDKAVVSHSLTYWNSFGQDGKTPNAYVAFEFALSDLPVGGGRAALRDLWVNSSLATWDPDATPGTYGIAIPEFNKDGRDHMWVEVFDGTQTEADAFLVSKFATDPDRPYEATRLFTGIVKVRVICRLNRDLFSGYPSFKFVVAGVPLYDLREDTTAGGDGAQRWSDDSTWTGGVENPITVAYNVIRGISYDGEWFFGGQTVSAAQLPFAAWNAAQNECDAEIENEDESVEPQFRCAGEIRLDMEPADVIEDLLRACNGRPGEIGGVYKPHVGAAGVAVLSITDDDVRTDEDQTFEPFLGLQDIVNAVNAKYIEPGEGWVAKDAPALTDAALESEDGGRRQPVDLQFEYVPFSRQVQRQCRAALTDYRRERRHVLPLAPEAWRLEPAIDFVSWTSERNGYTDKLFSVEGVTDMDGYLVGVSLKEVDPGDYDDVTSVPPTIAPTPQVLPPAQGIDDWDAEAVTLTTASGLSKPAIRLLWDGDDIDDVIGVEFQVWDNGLTEIIYEGTTAPSTVPLGEVVISANLVSATTYKVRGRFVPGSGREVTWSGYIAVTTPTILVPRNTLDPAFSDLMRRVNERLTSIEAGLDDLGAAVQALDSVQVTDNQQTVDRIQRITARVGSTRATVTQVQTVNATLVNALAALGIDVEAALGSDSAAGFLRIAAEVDGGGALAALLLGVAATRDGVGKEAAMKMVVDGLNSIIQFRAGQLQVLDDADDPFAVFDGATRTLFVERIASGSTSLYKEYTRANLARTARSAPARRRATPATATSTPRPSAHWTCQRTPMPSVTGRRRATIARCCSRSMPRREATPSDGVSALHWPWWSRSA